MLMFFRVGNMTAEIAYAVNRMYFHLPAFKTVGMALK